MEGAGAPARAPGVVCTGEALRFPPGAWRLRSSSLVTCGVVLGLLQPFSVLSAPQQCLGHGWMTRNAPLCFGCLIHCCAGNACVQCLLHAWARVPGLWTPPPGAASHCRWPGPLPLFQQVLWGCQERGGAGGGGVFVHVSHALFWPEFLQSIREDAPCDAGNGLLGQRAGGGGQRLRLLSYGSGRLRPVAARLSLKEGSGTLPPWPVRTPTMQRPASALQWKMGVRVSTRWSLCILVISTFDDLCSLEPCITVLQVQRGKVPDVQIRPSFVLILLHQLHCFSLELDATPGLIFLRIWSNWPKY